jgi:hypothetical protein
MFKKLICTAAMLAAGVAYAFQPQNGAWIVNSELDGKPGRGFGLDTQNGTLVFQVYAYDQSGRSLFYLASGPITNDRFSAPLMRYEGGRYLGSGPRTGYEVGSAGHVNIRFTSGTTGFITFPGEPEVAVSRFNFGYAAVPSSLRGIWTLTSMGSEGLLADAVELTRQTPASSGGNGVMETPNGLFGCEHQTRGSLAGGVLCVKINSAGTLQRAYYFLYSVDSGEGYSSRAGTGTEQMMFVQRVTTPAGVGTGIVYKSEPQAEAPSHPALLAHIEQLAAQGLQP